MTRTSLCRGGAIAAAAGGVDGSPTGCSSLSMGAPQLCTLSFAELDICGVESCPGGGTPEFPSLVCTLPVKHDGMHHQEGVNCSWEMGWDALLESDRG